MSADPQLRDEVRRTVGRRIAALRRARLLTQGDLAERLAWSRELIVHYENGRRTLPLDRLVAIARALEVPPAVLLIDDEQLAALVVQWSQDGELRVQVQFFLQMLREEAATAGEQHTRREVDDSPF